MAPVAAMASDKHFDFEDRLPLPQPVLRQAKIF